MDDARCGEPESEAPFWMFYSRSPWRRYRLRGVDHGFAVVVTLDGGTQHLYSGVRIVIVCRPEEDLSGLVVRDCLEPGKYTRHFFRKPGIPHRERLLQQREASKRSEYLLNRAGNDPAVLPLCSVVFEVINESDSTQYKVEVMPRETSALTTPFWVVYDRAFPCSPTHSTVEVPLECSHSLRGIRKPNADAPSRSPTHGVLWMHSIRVLPVSRVGRLTRKLSPEIALEIAWSVDIQKQGWRKDILSIAMVCKAWLPAIQVFVERMNELISNVDYPHAVSLFKSLELKPDLGRSWRRLSQHRFRRPDPEDEEANLSFQGAFINTLKMLPDVTYVDILAIQPSLRSALVDALSGLRRVKRFSYFNSSPLYDATGPGPSLADLQTCAYNWAELEDFGVQRWAIDSNQERNTSVNVLETKSFATRLHTLRLEIGDMTGPQLLRFASPNSVLRNVGLRNITGLKNSDLLAFLLQVAPSLEQLSLADSVFTREPDEEYALDVAMPNLTRLTQLFVYGDLLSALSISRRRPEKVYALGRPALLPKRISVISIAPGLRLGDLRAAMEVTGWDSITLTTRAADREEVLSIAEEVAKARGIDFVCYTQ